MAIKTLLSRSTSQSPRSTAGRIWSFILYVGIPILIGLGLAASLLLEPHYTPASGQPLTARFLHPDAGLDPVRALEQLQQRPTRLTEAAPAGPAWLLADLPDRSNHPPADRWALLLPVHPAVPPECWLVQPGDESAARLEALTIHSGLLGQQMRLPNASTANQALCRLELPLPARLAIERWQRHELSATTTHTAQAIGLLEGGLLTLAAFLLIIALTMGERPYTVMACWILCNLRLGAWVLGWDHQFLGMLIPPDVLAWVRKLTVLVYYILTVQLFTNLFQPSLDAAVTRRLRLVSRWSAICLLLALLVLSYDWLRLTAFLATWLATALVTVTLVHGLFRFNTRKQFWHTAGVGLALTVLLAGLILIGLGRADLIAPFPGAAALLLSNLLIALATADKIREDRQTRLRQRNDLIARDTLTPLGLFTLGATRHFEHLNPNARDILDIPHDLDLHALAWSDFFPQVDWLEVAVATEQGRDTEIQRIQAAPNAPARNFLLRATLVGSRIEGSLQDISARAETIRKLRLMADNDPLTDTLNRRGIEKAMQQAIETLQQSDTPCALAFLDLDHLKRVNDLFGHSTGDTLLQMVCERLKYSLSDNQSLGRIGNDEFIILFPGMRASEARRTAQDMIESLNGSALYIGERAFQLKSALGLIDIDRSMTPKDAIAAASRACRDARKQHQDVVLYEENAHELFDHIDELHLFEQLESTGTSEDVFLEMQPIMSLRHPLRTLNFEALLRVRSTGSRPLQTGKLIQAAEDSGMVATIDRWVFTTLLDWMSRHHLKLGQTRQVNVNLSGVSLNDDRFIDILFGILNQQPQFTRRLCVEITEGVALQDLERTRQFMRRLQRMGARVALDDFGAGYTSFSYLKELPADMIKIDGSLIRDMLASETNIAIVNSIVDLAHNLGMECIAEWVEDVATLRALTDMGVDYVQGYIISGSRPPLEILACDNILPLVADPAARAYIEEISGRRLT
ncbi:MAG: EAL domain-containing protein [Castellaniella sp.]|uniref:putative bifunctional diguanylate cyclase/phosphodiesterase n=1 Tax=Castellaniella sp. TaxID=1955812 RepID=UPI002A3593E6|nr:EAL domain-containing protein [Castellaniella sp.]MDY0309043.1 EAL domain-containing protein [Castellaniella sp.]